MIHAADDDINHNKKVYMYAYYLSHTLVFYPYFLVHADALRLNAPALV